MCGSAFCYNGVFIVELLSSVQNPKVKAYGALLSSSKQRFSEGLFVLEGLRLCMDVIRSNYTVEQLFFTNAAYKKSKEEIDALIAVSKECFEITDNVSLKMSDTKNPQGVFCIVGGLDKRNNSNKMNVTGKYILLENVQDPANLGAVSRTAEALGITGLIVSGGCDVYSPKALRASMGALLRLPVIMTDNVIETIESAHKNGMKTYASTPSLDAVDITNVSFDSGVIAVIGNEANGVTESTMRCCTEKITIPMTGRAESLNAGAAASIIMWEMVTPRNDKS